MTVWFDADGANARVAIYTGNDDLPMANPVPYIGTRLKFHTSLGYLPFVPAYKITATVTAVAAISDVPRGSMRRTIILAPHGMAGVPFIYGFATVNGIIRPMCGSIPIKYNSSLGSVIHWTLGVDDTNVFISEGRSYPTWNSGLDVPVEVFVSDKLVI